jgi:hypothetical protein
MAIQVEIPTQLQPTGIAATNANGWVYGLFEVGVVVAFVLWLTLPLWGKWLFRPFGSKDDE